MGCVSVREYVSLGAKFAKWRAVITIGEDMPSAACIDANCHALARYAALCQEAGIAPMVDSEVPMDGDHDIETCYDVTEATLRLLYNARTSNNGPLKARSSPHGHCRQGLRRAGRCRGT